MKLLIWTIALLLCIIPEDLYACGLCVMAYFDKFIPPVRNWCFLGAIWFFLANLVSPMFLKNSGLLLRFFLLVLLLLLSFVLGSLFLGPIPFIILYIFSFRQFLCSVSQKKCVSVEPEKLKTLRYLGFTAVVFILTFFAYSVYINLNRSDKEYIAEWGMAAPSRSKFEKLREREPASIDDYRYIIENASCDYIVVLAAGRLSDISNLKEDRIFIRNIRQRLESEKCSKNIVDKLAGIEENFGKYKQE